MLELHHVSFQIDGKYILKDINLTIADNKFTVMSGPNGGGKSTLAKLIMGIEQVSEGTISYKGIDITHMSVDERANLRIAYAFQQPPRFKGLSVRKLLSLAHGKELDEECCCRYLSDVGLCSKDYLDRDVDSSLSGGELKRIEIASILARDVTFSIFDEPEAGIDLWSFAKLVETFQNLQRESKQSILIISHQERIMQLADEIIIIEDGHVKTKGTKAKILPQLMSEFDTCAFKK